MFAGRTIELADLRRRLDSADAEVIVVTGHRRTGKSRLIAEACEHRNVIAFQAADETARLNFQAFRRTCIQALGPAGLDTCNDWATLLDTLAARARTQPGLVVVLDNFNALCEADETLPFVLRGFCRTALMEGGQLKLILSGSNVARMTDLTRGSPSQARHALAGLRTRLFELAPLTLREAAAFFPNYTDEARIAAYAVFGGVPAYLAACDPDKSLAVNIVELLLSPYGRLVDEPAHTLAHDLRDVKVYASILRAIANGCRESGEIRSFIMGAQTGMSISPYLEKLSAMRLIAGARAFDADPKARYMRFSICDPLTRFWNLFVQPNRLVIDQGGGAALFETTIKRQLGDYMVLGFEAICRDHAATYGDELFGARFEAVGQAWGDGYNLAIAGRLVGQRPLFGACAWQTRAVGDAGFAYLEQQARLSGLWPEDGGALSPPAYVVFSRSGFEAEITERARLSPNLRLVTPADILRPNPQGAYLRSSGPPASSLLAM
ncbi:MAG: ATP-binding protein [Asticcacaulis sp.]